MKRTRVSLKKYLESSESEEERPSKKSPPTLEKDVNNQGQTSSSESDIENYLQKPEKLDLDSEFFNTKTAHLSEFEKIERNIFAGVKRLSDSESDTDKEEETTKEEASKDDVAKKSSTQEPSEFSSSPKLNFKQLQDYTSKIEDAKRHVEIYKAKKHRQEKNTDILNLLAAGERKTGMEDKITMADLHSSDFESCESEQEDWEEIKTKTSHEKEGKNLIPTKGLQITVDMPDTVRKKKGVDILAALKRRLNRIRKENQLLVHKVHLLCWIAHGNYVNSAINDSQTMCLALSLLPSEQCYPSDRIDLAYLEQIVTWYKRTMKNIEAVVPEEMSLDKCLQHQISKKEAYNKKMLAIIFVAILRALGIQTRIVMSLQVEPLRPPASDLHSESTKTSKNKKDDSKNKQQDKPPKSKEIKKTIATYSEAGTSGKNKAATAIKNPSDIKAKSDIKIKIHGPSPEGKKILVSDKNIDAAKQKRRSKSSDNAGSAKSDSASQNGRKSATVNSKDLTLKSVKRSTSSRAKSTESIDSLENIGSRKTSLTKSSLKADKLKTRNSAKSTESLDSLQSTEKGRTKRTRSLKDKNLLNLDTSDTGKLVKSTESVDSLQSNASRKTKRTQDSKDKDSLKADQSGTKKRAKSTESVDSLQSNKSGRTKRTQDTKDKNSLKADNSGTRKRAKSTESIDSLQSNEKGKNKRTQNLKNKNLLNPDSSKTGKLAKSTESIDSLQSNASSKTMRTRDSKEKESLKADNLGTRKRAKSTESVDSLQSNQSGRTKRMQDTKDTNSLKADNSGTRKRTKSTESIDSVQSNGSTRSTRSSQAKLAKELKENLAVPNTKNRNSSADNKGSESLTKDRVTSSAMSKNANESRGTKTRSGKIILQVDGLYDSDSDFERDILQLDGANDKKQTKSKPNLKTLKKTPVKIVGRKSITKPNLKSLSKKSEGVKKPEQSDSDSEFEPYTGSPFNLNKLKNIKRQATKKTDVRSDVISLVKKRISEQKRIDRSRLAKKRKPAPDSDSDSDYAPEPLKKKHHDSEDDFVPKTKVKKRVQVHPVLSDSEAEKTKKKGNDVWVEVFLEAEEKWISVDICYGHVHCIKEISQRASHPISYVLTWDNNNKVKDVTQRYCPNFNTVTRKLRIDQKWWNASLKPFMGTQTARDREEDEDLARQQLDQPLPKAISEYKDHPLYALKRHLLKFQAIFPPEPPTLGFIRGEAVYPRGCVFTLHSREIWLKQAKVVKLGEEPYKIVKARPKWDKLSNTVITGQLLEIFGPWQVQDYDPPTAENGIVPRNAFGNVDLFKPCMLPKGCVHLKLPGLNKIARRMNIDCAAAITGFDFHSGWSHPIYDGFVVCQEYEDQLICAWELEQDEIERKEQEKIDKRVYGNWKKLIRGLLIRERLKARYDFGAPTSSKPEDEKKKGGATVSKKRK